MVGYHIKHYKYHLLSTILYLCGRLSYLGVKHIKDD